MRVRNPQVVIAEQVRDALQRRIDDLWARVAALGNPQPIDVLENAGFEGAVDGEQIAGWSGKSAWAAAWRSTAGKAIAASNRSS